MGSLLYLMIILQHVAFQTGESSAQSTVTSMDTLEHSVAELKQQLKSQEQKYASLLSSLISKVDQSSKELSSTKQTLSDLQNKHSQTALTLTNVTAEFQTYRRDVFMLSQRVDKCELNLSKLNPVVESLSQIANTSRNETSFVKSRLDQFELIEKDRLTNMSSMEENIAELKTIIRTMNSSLLEELVSKGSQRPLNGTSPGKVAFHAVLSNTTSSSNPIVFQDLNCNVGGGYNTTTGIFRAPVSGVYMLMANVKLVSYSNSLVTHTGGDATQQSKEVISTSLSTQWFSST